MAENPTAGLTQEEEEENIDYDSDGNPIASTTKKIIMPLPPIDHSEVQFTNRLSAESLSVVTTTNQNLKCSVFLFYLFIVLCFFTVDWLPTLWEKLLQWAWGAQQPDWDANDRVTAQTELEGKFIHWIQTSIYTVYLIWYTWWSDYTLIHALFLFWLHFNF